MTSLVERIIELIHLDNEDLAAQSVILKSIYNKASEIERKTIDSVMICLCGYSLDTILNKPEDIQI